MFDRVAHFLAIYSKHKEIDDNKYQKVVADFSCNGLRSIENIGFPKMQLYFVTKVKKYAFKNENNLAFISGHVSFEQIGLGPYDSKVSAFNEFISRNINFEKLEGAFSAVHYNFSTHQLIYLNDKFGIMPLFVYEDNECLLLSNEYQPLAVMNSNLSYDAIAEFLTLGVTLGNKIFYTKINNLAPATYVIVNPSSNIPKQYWQPEKSYSTKDIDALAKQMYDLFTKINQEYTDEKVSELCLLTAGADPRLIVSTLTPKQLANTNFYTSNLSFLKSTEDKDVIGATALATKFNLQHTVEKISFYENQFEETYFDKERELRAKHLYGGWHGGELLGGFCLNATPINKELNFKEVDEKYRSIFNWWFRFKQPTHPYQSYKNELEKLNGNTFLFMIHQLTRSFFSNIYGGTRGHWVQPFQMMNHGFSPFWDSRFLQLLIQIPLEELKNYNFYNQVFKHIDKSFTEIPTNSPLANREDSVIPKMNNGTEPKHQIPNTHHKAYKDCLHDAKIWNRKYYNKKELLKISGNEFATTSKQWLDFEVWYSRYVK